MSRPKGRWEGFFERPGNHDYLDYIHTKLDSDIPTYPVHGKEHDKWITHKWQSGTGWYRDYKGKSLGVYPIDNLFAFKDAPRYFKLLQKLGGQFAEDHDYYREMYRDHESNDEWGFYLLEKIADAMRHGTLTMAKHEAKLRRQQSKNKPLFKRGVNSKQKPQRRPFSDLLKRPIPLKSKKINKKPLPLNRHFHPPRTINKGWKK